MLLPQSRADLQQHAKYSGRNNADKAVEFFAAARQTFRELADSPFLGSPQFFSDAAHHSLRRWPVNRPFSSGDGVPLLEEVEDMD